MSDSRLAKDQVEKIVKADLQRHYPDIKHMEFRIIRLRERLKPEWWVEVVIVLEDSTTRTVFYRLDAGSGEIKEYRVR